MIAKRSITAMLILFCCCSGAAAQTVRRPVISHVMSLGTPSDFSNEVFACLMNQACLAGTKKPAIAVYGERKFMLSELALYHLGALLPTRFGTVGFKGSRYGFPGYNEIQAGLAYGRSLGPKVDVGIQFNYYVFKASGYGHAETITGEAGLRLHLTQQMVAGVHINNPAGGKFGRGSTEKLPFVYTATLVYAPSAQALVSLIIEKEEQQPLNVIAGLAYHFAKTLSARIGMATATGSSWLAIRINLRSVLVELSAGYHQQLGFTPGLLVQSGGGIAGMQDEHKSGLP